MSLSSPVQNNSSGTQMQALLCMQPITRLLLGYVRLSGDMKQLIQGLWCCIPYRLLLGHVRRMGRWLLQPGINRFPQCLSGPHLV